MFPKSHQREVDLYCYWKKKRVLVTHCPETLRKAPREMQSSELNSNNHASKRATIMLTTTLENKGLTLLSLGRT